MSSLLHITITGFVGSDPAARTVQTSNGEKQVASFSVAVNRTTSNGQKQTLWIRANCWNGLSEIASRYVKKGSHVQLTSNWLRPSAWVDQSGSPQASLDMDVDRLILLDRPNGESDADDVTEDDRIPF